MTGLDAILATIEEDAQNQAASLLEAAREAKPRFTALIKACLKQV